MSLTTQARAASGRTRFSGSAADPLKRVRPVTAQTEHRTHGLQTRATGMIASPCGMLRAQVSDLGVVALDWAPAVTNASDEADHPILLQLRHQLFAYFAGTLQTFTVPLAPTTGTPFQRACWAYLHTIPYAQTRTYGQQAAALGNPAAGRAVGAANGQNPVSILVPCHRVIGSTGALTGFGGGIENKRWLLEHEAAFAETRNPKPEVRKKPE